MAWSAVWVSSHSQSSGWIDWSSPVCCMDAAIDVRGEARLIEDHARWLLSGESVLILQAPIETLQVPVAVLLESGEIQPAVFILYPKRESPTGEDWSPGHRSPRCNSRTCPTPGHGPPIGPGPPQNTELLKRIERGRRWVHEACLDLAVANRLEQSVSPAARVAPR